jgi:hypothetical protein
VQVNGKAVEVCASSPDSTAGDEGGLVAMLGNSDRGKEMELIYYVSRIKTMRSLRQSSDAEAVA